MIVCKTTGQMRCEAALEAFNKALSECDSVMAAFKKAATGPAPRFFVTLPIAMRHVAQIERTGTIACSEGKAALYTELHRRWKATGSKTYGILEEIIEEPAPSFYIGEEAFKALVYKTMKNGGNKKDNRKAR